jgi:menaquinone-dependent protoporphyrinogen oxidase
MKILALYGSSYGQAEAVLQRIGHLLEEQGNVVTVIKGDALPRDLVLEEFDAVIMAASIIMGRYQSYIRKFAQRYAAQLNALPTAFVSVNGHASESSPEWRSAAQKYVRHFLAATGWQPHWTATFSGALRYSRYGPFVLWMMKIISRSTGGPTDTKRDYEFTDWKAVETFAQHLAEEWSAAPVS